MIPTNSEIFTAFDARAICETGTFEITGRRLEPSNTNLQISLSLPAITEALTQQFNRRKVALFQRINLARLSLCQS
jgi:hypothetical protein